MECRISNDIIRKLDQQSAELQGEFSEVKMPTLENSDRTNASLQEINDRCIQVDVNFQNGIMNIANNLERKVTKQELLESQVKVINNINISIMSLSEANRSIHIEDQKVVLELKEGLDKSLSEMKQSIQVNREVILKKFEATTESKIHSDTLV
jgi:hypothetical protein